MLACSYHSIYLFIECLCSYIYMHGRAGHVFGSVAAQLMYSFAMYVVLKFSPYFMSARATAAARSLQCWLSPTARALPC